MSQYLSLIKQSYSVAFADYVRQKESAGQKIIKMQTGDPDFPTHPTIVDAASKALQDGETKYCDSRGLAALRGELVNKLFIKNNIYARPENILITHGAVHGIGIAIRALLDQGNECIIIEPFWRSYEANVILTGARPVFVTTKRENGFQLIADDVVKCITSNTKLIIINTPNNPSGAVYRPEELRKLGHEASKRGIYILSDEVYENLIFEDTVHYSMASDVSISPWIISAFSFSKTYAMTGWRIGYVVASAQLIDELLKLSQFSITSLSPFSQIGAITALINSNSEQYAEHMRYTYASRLKKIELKIAGTWLEKACTIPEGAFYLLIDIRHFGVCSLEMAKRIVDSHGVSFTPGIAFGDNMDCYLRMCFASSEDNIDAALESLIVLGNG